MAKIIRLHPQHSFDYEEQLGTIINTYVTAYKPKSKKAPPELLDHCIRREPAEFTAYLFEVIHTLTHKQNERINL